MKKIIERVKQIVFKPKETWETIATEEATISGLFKEYLLVLAGVPALAAFLGRWIIGIRIPFVGVYRYSFGSSLLSSVLWYVLIVVGVWVGGKVISILASHFGSARDDVKGFKVALYSYAPFLAAGVLYLVPSLSVLVTIAGLYGLDHAPAVNGRISELLELFELDHWQDELIESYSHGMKQRLVMCSALLHSPKVIIVDEPMVGLDPKASRLVKNIFRDQAGGGATVFMSTHSLEVAEEVCEEIAIIQAGRIIAQGTAEDLRRKAGMNGSLENIFLRLTEGGTVAHERPLSSR